jgi:hypothetical protein
MQDRELTEQEMGAWILEADMCQGLEDDLVGLVDVAGASGCLCVSQIQLQPCEFG